MTLTTTRRRIVAGTITLGVTIASCGLLAAPAQAAPADEAAQASVLRGAIAGVDLASVLGATAGTASPGTSDGALDSAALNQLLNAEVSALGIPLSELVAFGDLGAASATATTTAEGDATATATSVGDDLNAVRGSTTNAAAIDLTELFASIGAEGLTDAAIDEATLTLGALGATATIQDGTIIDGEGDGVPGDYAIAGSSIQLHSALVGEMLAAVDGQVTGLGETLAEIVTSQAVRDEVATGLGAIDLEGHEVVTTDVTAEARGIDAALAGIVEGLIPAEGLTHGAVTVRADGTITVDLAQLHGGSLGGLEANTPLLTDETLAAVSADLTHILASITEGLTETVVAALAPIEVRIGADLAVEDATDEATIVASIEAQTVEETLAQLESLGLTDARELAESALEVISLGGLVPREELLASLTGDLALLDLVQAPIVDALLGAEDATVSADAVVTLGDLLAGSTKPEVGVQVMPLATGADVDAIAASVTGVFGPTVQTVLATTVAPATVAISDALGDDLSLRLGPSLTTLLSATDALFDGIDEQLAITINSQPEEAFIEGDSAFTVEAALVEVAGISLGLGSASVAVDESWTTTISADPDSVEGGDTVTITGEGFEPFEEATITIDGAEAGSTPADENGALVPFVWTVPEDAPPGDVPVAAIGAISQTEARDAITITVTEAPAGLTPTVRIPEQVTPGETVEVELEGWAPVETVTLTLEEDGEPVTEFEPVETVTDEEGEGEAEIVIPTTVTPGAEIEVVGRGETGEGRDDTVVPADEEEPVDPGTDSNSGSDTGSDGSDGGSDGTPEGGSDGGSGSESDPDGGSESNSDGNPDGGSEGSDEGSNGGSDTGTGSDEGSNGVSDSGGTDGGSDGSNPERPTAPGTDGSDGGSDSEQPVETGSNPAEPTDADEPSTPDSGEPTDDGSNPEETTPTTPMDDGAVPVDPGTDDGSVPAAPADAPADDSSTRLVRTGADGAGVAGVAFAGVLALLGGAATLLLGRRRRKA